MGTRTQELPGERGASPYRLVVVAGLAIFWATLLLALGVPGAGVILVAALGASVLAGVRLALPHAPRPSVGPLVSRVAAPVARARAGVRRPRRLPALPALRAPLAARARAAARFVPARPKPTAEPQPVYGPGRAGEAFSFCRLGAQLRQEGRLAASVESFETAVWIFRDLDDQRGLALALNGLGLALARQRRLDVAVARYREAAEILDGLGDRHAHGQVLANLGTALRSQGRSDEARASWEDALTRLEPGSAEAERTGRELRAAG